MVAGVGASVFTAGDVGSGMRHPQNYRAYGLLLRAGRVLVAAEYVGRVFAWKYPGGGVVANESAPEAVRREFREETGLAIRVVRELHDPGTKISPWTGAPYTPVYFLVAGEGRPAVPDGEELALRFMAPARVLASSLVAAPEKAALRAALGPGGGAAPP